jgi:hypothetical protein
MGFLKQATLPKDATGVVDALGPTFQHWDVDGVVCK